MSSTKPSASHTTLPLTPARWSRYGRGMRVPAIASIVTLLAVGSAICLANERDAMGGEASWQRVDMELSDDPPADFEPSAPAVSDAPSADYEGSAPQISDDPPADAEPSAPEISDDPPSGEF